MSTPRPGLLSAVASAGSKRARSSGQAPKAPRARRMAGRPCISAMPLPGPPCLSVGAQRAGRLAQQPATVASRPAHLLRSRGWRLGDLHGSKLLVVVPAQERTIRRGRKREVEQNEVVGAECGMHRHADAAGASVHWLETMSARRIRPRRRPLQASRVGRRRCMQQAACCIREAREGRCLAKAAWSRLTSKQPGTTARTLPG